MSENKSLYLSLEERKEIAHKVAKHALESESFTFKEDTRHYLMAYFDALKTIDAYINERE